MAKSTGDDALYDKSIAQLRALDDDDLVAQHDALIAIGGYTTNPSAYREELARRAAERQGDRMLALTKVIAALTVVNVGAVVAIALFAG